MSFQIAIGARVRKSPFFNKTVAEGVAGFSVYNHMYMPTGYGDIDAEYDRLINGVAMWDVAVERQVELKGPDAEKLARVLTTRNLDNTKIEQGRYVPLCDHRGTIINDPVLLPLAKNHYWLSIADSDICMWARGIAAERGLDVAISEPDVSPLAIQGPKAKDVVADMFGDWIRDLKYFGFKAVELDGIPLLVARSGWSKQGGYELYLRNGEKGNKLWDLVKEAGTPYDIGPGTPNYIERIESGLVSYGADTDDQTNPYELGLGKYVNLDQEVDFIGKQALTKIHSEGIKRQFVGFYIQGDMAAPAQHKWRVTRDGKVVGFISASCYSPRIKGNIGTGLIASELANSDAVLDVDGEHGTLKATVTSFPFKI